MAKPSSQSVVVAFFFSAFFRFQYAQHRITTELISKNAPIIIAVAKMGLKMKHLACNKIKIFIQRNVW